MNGYGSEIILSSIWANKLLGKTLIKILDAEEEIVTSSLLNYFYFQRCLR